MNDIKELKDKYNGGSVLFLGAGRSLLDFDLETLSTDIYTFGFNRVIPHYIDFWPNMKLDFYMSHDPTVFQTSFYEQFTRRKDLYRDEGYEINNEFVIAYKDTSIADFIIDKSIYKDTQIILSDNIKTGNASRFNLKHNSDWIKANEEIIEQSDNFFFYKINDKVGNYHDPVLEGDRTKLALWGKNSFCNSALPMLMFMGFKKIYLLGVDYTADGYFFCKSTNHEGYVSKEYAQFSKLMGIAEEKGVEIYTIDSDKTKITAKGGRVKFEELT